MLFPLNYEEINPHLHYISALIIIFVTLVEEMRGGGSSYFRIDGLDRTSGRALDLRRRSGFVEAPVRSGIHQARNLVGDARSCKRLKLKICLVFKSLKLLTF